jgi:hypothetical protein
MDHMQLLLSIKTSKLSKYQRDAKNTRKTLVKDFERNVMQDQAASVFMTANARILLKATKFN